LEKRKGKGLDFDKSLSIILDAAKERRFLSYIELAEASGTDWNHVRFATGQMDPSTLKAFIGAARELGYPVTDAQGFLREQQARVFARFQDQQSLEGQ
jgi:hypothetical protein